MNEKFEVHFTIGHVHRIAEIPSTWPQCEDAVKSGFWVNNDWKLGDVHAKRVIWIPPSRIDFVERSVIGQTSDL